jgi:hypothetical protein
LFRRGEGEAGYERVEAIGWSNENARRLTPGNSLVHGLELRKIPLQLEGDDILSGEEISQRQLAFSTLAVPLISRGSLIAIAFYGVHKTGDDLNKEEIVILDELAKTASAAYESIEASSLRHQGEELKERLHALTNGGSQVNA